MKRVLALTLGLIFVMLAFASCTHVHAFGEWEIEKEATCTSKGTRVHRCECGVEEREETDPAAHQYAANGVCSVCKMPKGVFVDANGVKWTTDEWGNKRRYDDLPVDLNYGGRTVTVLCWDSAKAEFIQTEDSEDARLHSIYNRNKAVRERLGVALNFITEHSSSGSGITTFMTRVQNAKNSGTHAFDIIATYSRTQGALLSNGLLYDLNDIQDSYLDFSNPWWPTNLEADATIADSLYFLYGDITPTTIDKMHCVYVNGEFLDEKFEQRAQDAGFNTATDWLYDKVYKGEWTVDLLIDLATSDTYRDKTENGPTVDDDYGLCAVNYTISTLYGGSGLRILKKDSQGQLVLSDQYTSSSTAALVTKLSSLITSPYYHDNNTGSSASSSNVGAPFKRGNALFYVTYFDLAEDALLKSEVIYNYGVLPLPKLGVGQETYHTILGNGSSVYSVFVDFDARDDKGATARMLSAVLECWASESYRRCVPVVLKNGISRFHPKKAQLVDMHEYIHDALMLDLGRIMAGAMTDNADYSLMLDNYVFYAAQQNKDWETYYSALDLAAIEQNLAAFMSKLKAGTLG